MTAVPEPERQPEPEPEPERQPQPYSTVDALGWLCPVPVIELARQVLAAPVGAVVAVLADDPAARLDIPAWCRMRGHDYLGDRPLPDAAGSAFLVRRCS